MLGRISSHPFWSADTENIGLTAHCIAISPNTIRYHVNLREDAKPSHSGPELVNAWVLILLQEHQDCLA